MAAIATTNSGRSPRQRCLRAETLNRPATATNTTAASTGWGNAASRLREEEHHHQNDPRREGAGQRRARAPAFVDERLRHAAADRETAAQPGGEVGRGEREEFLVGIQPPAVLGREHAADGGRLHRAEQKARERQRQQFVQVGPAESPGGRWPAALAALRPAASPRARPGRASAEATMPPTTTNNATGLFLRKIFPSTSTARAMPPTVSEAGLVSPRCFRKCAAVLPEIAVGAVDAEQLGQLRAGEEQRHAALEPDHHALGDEVDDRARLDQPGDEGDERHQQGRARRQRAEPGRVAAGNVAQRRADEQGNGGGDRDGRVPRTAEQPEDQPAKQARVESRLGRQVGQRGVAQAGRQQVGGERDAGDDVAPQPAFGRRRAASRGQEAGYSTFPCWSGLVGLSRP